MLRCLVLTIFFYSIFLSPLFCATMPFGQGLDINLQDAVYGDGIVSTDKGGVIQGKDFFLQAKNLQYIRTGEGENEINKIVASEYLLAKYKDRFYHGDKAEFNLTKGTLIIWNGCAQSGPWYIGGDVIEIFSDGHGTIINPYITTSENEQNDWTLHAQKAEITKDGQVTTHNATFNFEKMPLLWVPTFSTDLFRDIRAPIRVRAKFGNGARLGLSYLFTTGPIKNRALVDYSTRYGIGCGLRSQYINKGGYGTFDALNYVAQSKDSFWGDPRYRMQGLYKNYLPEEHLHFLMMYDKLSDSGMITDFSDHPITRDALAGLTQGSIWRTDPNWIARLNARVRINTFQTVKQELPLLTFNTRPCHLGNTPIFLDNRLRAGYLNYVYAHRSRSVHNFDSTRTEISQRLYTTVPFFPITLSPSIGYHVIHYNRSPQQQERLQGVADCSLEAKTRFVKNDLQTPQIAEPYTVFSSISSPLVRPGRTYIFDIEDGWQRVNELRYGVRNFWWLSPQDAFQKKLFVDLYTRSYFSTPHLKTWPTKLWLDATWDATPTLAFKLNSAWDWLHSRYDHINAAVRKTLSESLAIILESRNRSPYDWRKLDRDSYILDAAHSMERLRHSELSDARNSVVARLFWSLNPAFDIEGAIYEGWRPKSPRHYYNYEINIGTLIRGALRVELTIITRPGGPSAVYFSCDLGPKKESGSTSFRKIGQGNYDIW